jgi:CRP/FNR family transcriptional regulator
MTPLPSILETAPAIVRSEFTQHARPFDLPAGKQVLLPGQPCAGMSFVMTGSVRVHLLSRGGHEIALYRVEGGHGCVLSASCILGGTAFPASAVVERRAGGLGVAADVFREWVERQAFWRKYVFALLGQRLAAVFARFEEAMFDALETRLARLLRRRADSGQRVVRATHAELANELGSAREVVSRTLGRWQQAGVLRLHRGAVEMLRQDELLRMARL